MAESLYMIESGTELLTNPSFTTNLNNWTDATGSWTWDATGGAVYDNDDENNPLTQVVTLATGWHYVARTLSGGYTGTLTLRIADTNGTAVFGGNFSDPYFLVETAGDYTVDLVAVDFVGVLQAVSLQTAKYYLPTPGDASVILQSYASDFSLNPVFETNLSSWTAGTGWTWATGGGAQYSHATLDNELTQSVTFGPGWFRFGFISSVADSITASISGVADSLIDGTEGAYESYFYVSATAARTITITTDHTDPALLHQVSLIELGFLTPLLAVTKEDRVTHAVFDSFEVRTFYNRLTEKSSMYIGRLSGDQSLGLGNVAIGFEINENGNDKFIVANNPSKPLIYADFANDATVFNFPDNTSAAAALVDGSAFAKGLVVNETGADSDTRIEGDTEPNLLFADASADTLYLGGTSTRQAHDKNGDAWFEGSGAGMPFGSFYGNGIAKVFTAAVQNTWNLISDTDAADGELNLVTHDGSGKLTVNKAGRYLITYAVSLQANASSVKLENGIAKNGTVVNDGRTSNQLTSSGTAPNFDFTASSTAIINLAANDTLELATRTTSTGTPTITVSTINMTILQVGA